MQRNGFIVIGFIIVLVILTIFALTIVIPIIERFIRGEAVIGPPPIELGETTDSF